ncbi:MAG TPA: GreA/GreB family elongation factor [Pseudobacteroides sp.]|uniref:GreA/GreB family elongation factor n=1 Tax=Pseudobacteroides sp. TaxID=1968840 RepID=UPI002F95EA2E
MFLKNEFQLMYLERKYSPMTSNFELTTYVYRAILNHLVDFEERKNDLVNEIYSEPSALRDDFSCLLDIYLKKLEDLIKSSQIAEIQTREKIKDLNHLPYVIIGSTVELENASDLGTYLFRIVSPFDSSSSNKDLSYISELGRSLLLKKRGDVIKSDINNSVCSYQIKSIRYDGIYA